MSNFTRWILLNIFLPLSPFALRVFIILIGSNPKNTMKNIAEIPELLFYSIFICVLALNINFKTIKRRFEHFIRLFLFIVIILDFITLCMVYSKNIGPNTLIYSIITALISPIIAILYKFIYQRNKNGI
jgi:hypothetical protein